jgi:hypothetical protein
MAGAGEAMTRKHPDRYNAWMWQPAEARMHPSTALAVAPADRVAPVWWPVYDIRRHYASTRIVLSDDEPRVPERE